MRPRPISSGILILVGIVGISTAQTYDARIDSGDAPLSIDNSTVSANLADDFGGGIFVPEDGTLESLTWTYSKNTADLTPLQLLFKNTHDDPETKCSYASFETKVFEDYEPLGRFVMHSIGINERGMEIRLTLEYGVKTSRIIDFTKGTTSESNGGKESLNLICLGPKGTPADCAKVAKGLADSAEYLLTRFQAGTSESKDDQWNGLTCAAALTRAFQEYMEDRS
jgi:hypothetical protein